MEHNNTSWTPPAQNKYDSQVGEDDVFMTLDLPLEPSESRSNSEGSGSHSKFLFFLIFLNFFLN